MTANSLVPSIALREHWLDTLAATLQAGQLISRPESSHSFKNFLNEFTCCNS
jgi:hypothetical protein